MDVAAANLDFEKAANLRDKILELSFEKNQFSRFAQTDKIVYTVSMNDSFNLYYFLGSDWTQSPWVMG